LEIILSPRLQRANALRPFDCRLASSRPVTVMSKKWFVSYRRPSRPPGSSHARKTETFESEAEARAFASTLSKQSDINAGTINPHTPKEFYGAAKIDEWLNEKSST
jgi:hypothetical protein